MQAHLLLFAILASAVLANAIPRPRDMTDDDDGEIYVPLPGIPKYIASPAHAFRGQIYLD